MFTYLLLPLLLVACTSKPVQSPICRATTPYDYSNFPAVEKGDLPYVPTYSNCPAPVVDVLAREYRCSIWYGEEKTYRTSAHPKAAFRHKQAVGVLKYLRCDQIDNEIQDLQIRYGSDPVIRRLLENSKIAGVI